LKIEETRLVLVSKPAASRLALRSPSDLRRIARYVAQCALRATALDPIDFEVSDDAARAELQCRLERSVEELDAIYFDLADAQDAGKATEQQVLQAFSRARAMNSALFAIAVDPIEAAAEAAYEAQAATGALTDLEAALASA
jgi:hypothetical protein